MSPMGTSSIAKMALFLAVAAALVACGGGKSGKGAETAKSPTGQTIRTAGGQEVTKEAFNKWNRGLALFEEYEGEGWNQDRCGEVISMFEEANEAQVGNFGEALYMIGLTHARCGREDEALSFYKRALQSSPKLCGPRAAVGVDHMEKGRDQPAFQTFRTAIQNDPRCKEAYVNLAILQRERGENDEARKNLRRALAIESDYLPAFNELAAYFLKQADSPRAQSLDLAEIVCRQAQLLDAEYAPIYNTWGLIKMKREEIIEALRFFGKARSLDDDMFAAHMNFGQVTLSFRGYEDAKQAFSRAVELQPKSYEAKIGLGVAFRGLEQVDKAEAQYEEAQEMDPQRAEAYFNLGLLYQDYRQGSIDDYEKAKKYYEQFLSRAENSRKFEDTVESVKRRCRMKDGKPLRRGCRPGRLQNIATALEALREMEEMQRQMEQQQQQQQQG
jgi:tetratricopeptide (TPR) repeat protein